MSQKPTIPRGNHAAPQQTRQIPPQQAQQTRQIPQQQVRPQPYPHNHTVMPPSAMPEMSRKRNPLKIIAIMLGILLALLLVAYAGVALYFSGRFMPNSTIGKIDVSLMSASDAEQALTNSVENYKLSISGQGFTLDLSASDAGLSVDEGAIVKEALGDVNSWAWPFELGKTHDETEKLVAATTGAGLEDTVRTAVETFNTTATQPTNANISYSSASGTFSITPEAIGTALDTAAVVKAADNAIGTLTAKVTLTPNDLAQPTVLSTDPRLATAIESANTMVKTDLTLTMSGTKAGEVTTDLVAEWITIDDNAGATLDETALTAWVDKLAAACNTVGTTRTYTRPDGKVFSVSGGVYGWEVDYDTLLSTVKTAVAAGQQDTVAIPSVTTGTAYNGAGAQDWSARYCDIDLSEQHARFYDESGALVWESDIVTGIPDGEHDTPTGVYWLNQKASPTTLKGYSGDTQIYDTEVQYWMPFVGNAIGLHDAEWQPAFGGTCYKDGAGSHGCVNLSPSAAGELYSIIQGGDVVVTHW